MKKITLIVALLCSLSAFSTRYLVQGSSGTNTWRTAGSGEVNVTLGSTLKAWYDGQSMAANDEVWLAAGTYSVTATLTTKTDVHLYGSFAGTEVTIADRSKVVGGKSWEFSNQTILNGNQGDYVGLGTSSSNSINTYIDGLEITGIKRGGGNANGGAVQLRGKVIMQNCIVDHNQFIGTGTATGKGAGVFIKDGQLLNSYIHHNDCLIGTSSGFAFGGGIAIWGSALAVVKGCTIENNSATHSGGGIYLNDDGTYTSGGNIQDCIFQSNSVIAGNVNYGGGGGAICGFTSTNANITTLYIKNCQFIENTTTHGAVGDGGAVYLDVPNVPVSIEGCSFVGNMANALGDGSNGGGAMNIKNGVFTNYPIKNCVFRDNKITTDGTGVTAEGSALVLRTPATLQNCVFANNSSLVSGSSTVAITQNGCKILNSTFVQNLTTGIGRPISTLTRTFVLTNCVFWGNSIFSNALRDAWTGTTGTYNAFDTDQSGRAEYGTGSISTLTSTNTFVLPSTFIGAPTDAPTKAESAAANWRLQITSPAVDAGTDLTTLGVVSAIDGTARPAGTAYDMGAYERSSVPTSNVDKIDNAFVCFSSNQTIVVTGIAVGESVNVYGVTGNSISSKKATNSSYSISLPKGIKIYN